MKFEQRKQRLASILKVLKKIYPKPAMALNFSNTWEMLVAVILSAQCTDKKVNEVTEFLFKKYKTLDDYLKANLSDFQQEIRQTGFYKNKAKNILATAKIIAEKFGGRVPDIMLDLLTLPGVARKTANIILKEAYGKVEGIAVDTHVRRFIYRFDLSDFTDPKIIEKDLMKLLPKKEWGAITLRFIDYGRDYCPARKHDCKDHPLTKVWPQAADRWIKSK